MENKNENDRKSGYRYYSPVGGSGSGGGGGSGCGAGSTLSLVKIPLVLVSHVPSEQPASGGASDGWVRGIDGRGGVTSATATVTTSPMLLCANPPLSSLLSQSTPAASYLSQADLLLIPWNTHHLHHHRSVTTGSGSGSGSSDDDNHDVEANLTLTSIEHPPYQHPSSSSGTSTSIATLPHHAIFRDLVVGYVSSPSTTAAIAALMGTT